MAEILVSGLLNVETSAKVRGFPINYYPIDYAFFGVNTAPGGVGFNLASALKRLGSTVTLCGLIADDFGGRYVSSELEKRGISADAVSCTLAETPSSVVLYDESGRRQVYCDLKDIQEWTYEFDPALMDRAEIIAATNINFSRPLLKLAKAAGKKVATDVHVLSDIEDGYNREFMEAADILFLSHEGIRGDRRAFIFALESRYKNEIIVLGMGAEGALMYLRDENRFIEMPAFRTDAAVNTVGAGDALFAAFLNFYGKGFAPVEALERAQMFAALKIRVSGAARGFSTEAEIEGALKNAKR